MPVKDHLLKAVDDFNRKASCDANLQKELNGIRRIVNIDLGTEHYSFVLENQCIHSFDEGILGNPDIVLNSDPQTIEDVFTGRMKPMKAWALKKVRVKGSLEDILRLRKFF